MNVSGILIEKIVHRSARLNREVNVDFYLPKNVSDFSHLSLLLINDGQNLEEMGFAGLLESLHATDPTRPLLAVGIHAGEHRKMEYGVAGHPDYAGRGAKAGAYTAFILEELLPFIYHKYNVSSFREIAFAGFSLGGLSALDIVWNHPGLFKKAGVFSGSFWWRSLDQDNPHYDDDKHRIIHQQIRHGQYKPGLKFFFQCGNKDETKDRNHNGIIDSIDDTLDLVRELESRGYHSKKDIFYLEMPEGGHDIPTWASAMPAFLSFLTRDA